LLGIILILCSATFAQVETATISGVITDQSGGIVVGAEVRVTNSDTNITSIGTSNQFGVYLVTGLKPGRYRIKVEKQGFKGIDLTDLVLNVQASINRNFTLQLGSVSESISVEGGAPLINTLDASVSTVVDRKFVENMPLNGRSFQALIALTPGVVVTQATSTEPGQFAINGQRADANYFTVDGVSANIGTSATGSLGQFAAGALPGFSAQGGTNTLVTVDAMQEFRIQTSSFAPEFGRSPGGQVSIVTRSGTNDFHGLLFDYFRNDSLDANNWFNTARNPPLPKAKDRQNDFGGVFGGPIVKNKTFFFFSYEGLRLRQPRTTLSTVPCDSTCQVFGNARTMAVSAIQPYLNAYPVPNGPEVFAACTPNVNGCPASGQRPSGSAQFNSSYSNPSSLDAYSMRVDHTINSRLTWFGRYNYAPSEAASRLTTGLSTTGLNSVDTHTLTVGLTAAFSTNISNELRSNYSNVRSSLTQRLDAFGGATPLSDGLLFPPTFSSRNGLFRFSLGTFFGSPTFVAGKNATGEQRQINLLDNLSVAIGTHQLKFGMDYRWLAPFNSPLAYSQQALFSGVSAAVSPTPKASSVVVQAQADSALLFRNFSLYGQDSWRMTRRLTLTYGLRWDVNPPVKGKDSASEPFTVLGLDNPATMTLAPRGTPLYPTTYGNVAPRLGAAYQVRQRQGWELVLRGGFGLFYDLGSGNLGAGTSGFPYTVTKRPILFSIPFPLTQQQAAPPSFTLNPPVSSLVGTDPNLKLPRTYEWNVALEQALGSRQTVSITYVGAAGSDLLRPYLLFNPNANFSQVSVSANAGTSNYESLQLRFQRSISHGLQVLASYTFSHSIDNASHDSGSFSAPIVSSANLDWGNSDFDVRHGFTSAVSYEVPSPGQRKAVREIFGGWSAETLLFARSALPVDLVGRVSLAEGTLLSARPNVVLGQPFDLYGSQYPGGKAFNPAAFSAPPTGKQGNLGRNVLRGFGMWQADFALRRQFHLSERLGLEFRADFFNIFNHPNFGNPSVATIGVPLFGRSTKTLADSLGAGGIAGGFNPLYQVGGPRSIQLGLKVRF
jgi:hypothetical protein